MFYRIFRIITVISFLVVASFLRTNLVNSYTSYENISSSLSNNLKVENLSQNKEENDYTIKITNYDNHDRTFTIALITSNENTIPNNNIKYKIIRDDTFIKTDNLSQNGYLSKQTLKKEESSIYKIKIWLDNTKQPSDGKFSSKIALV